MLYRSVNDSDQGRGAATEPFRLLRWFAILGGVAILLVALAAGLFLARFVERSSLSRDAAMLAQLLDNIVEVEEAAGFFADEGSDEPPGDIEEFFNHLGRMPGVLRAVAYAKDHRIVWSSDPALIGQRIQDNEELEEAFAGSAVAEIDVAGPDGVKPEQAAMVPVGARFVENYLPIRAGAVDGPVVGVVEVYRAPPGLFAAIREANTRLIAGIAVAAVLLYASLFVIVWRGTRIWAAREARLVAAEKLATAGEMASAVAHGLRNPLASIRSSAELALSDTSAPDIAAPLGDIVQDVDRLEAWIRQYLNSVRQPVLAGTATDVAACIGAAAEAFAAQAERAGIALAVDIANDLPKVRLGDVVLGQIVNGLIANAIEAMPGGGTIRLSARAEGRELVRLRVEDDGPGMSPRQLDHAFEPFMTSKPGGLGLGLPMAREILERHGGRLDLASRPGHGTTATLRLPATAEQAA
ncbi:MAG: ATP-binding protein [Geminicoccaceae bacterium]